MNISVIDIALLRSVQFLYGKYMENHITSKEDIDEPQDKATKGDA